MYLFVAGDKFEDYTGRDRADLNTNELHESAHHPRYFLMVSALDFQAAIKRKPILLWCARVSTELAGRNLEDALPTLIATGVPQFGENTDGPKFVTSPPIPMGRVEVGTPVLKTSDPGKPWESPSSARQYGGRVNFWPNIRACPVVACAGGTAVFESGLYPDSHPAYDS